MKTNQPKVSIILPTYNVYPYLAQCLDSIVAQTYKNIEVIIVIDGATDGSYELAKEYCQRDSRFSVYWQENAGSGPARNNGLSHATGEFVMFIDPDDWVKEDYVERLVDAQKEGDYDLVATTSEDYYFAKDKTVKHIKTRNVEDSTIIGLEEVRKKYALLNKMSIVGAPTKKMYKMAIIKEREVCFPDFRRSQDVVFNYRYYDYISSIKILNYHGYCYRIEFSKTLARLKPDYYKTIITLYKETKSLHEKWDVCENMPLIATLYANIINAYLESCVANSVPIKEFIYNKDFREIVDLSSASNIYGRVFKTLFMARTVLLLKWTLKIKHKIKLYRLE